MGGGAKVYMNIGPNPRIRSTHLQGRFCVRYRYPQHQISKLLAREAPGIHHSRPGRRSINPCCSPPLAPHLGQVEPLLELDRITFGVDIRPYLKVQWPKVKIGGGFREHLLLGMLG